MLSKGFLKKELHSGKYKFFIGLAILAVVAALVTLSYDYTMRMLETAPVPEFARGQLEQLKDYPFWIWSQWFGKNLIQLGSGLALIFGAGIISSEVSRKTLQFLLAKPIHRKDIFTVKYVTNLAALSFVIIAATALLYVLVVATGHSFPIVKLFSHSILVIAGLSVVFSIGAYFSTVFDQTMKAFLASGAAALALAIPGFFEPLQEYSLYYQMSGISMFNGGGFPLVSFGIGILLSFALYNLGKQQMERKDY